METCRKLKQELMQTLIQKLTDLATESTEDFYLKLIRSLEDMIGNFRRRFCPKPCWHVGFLLGFHELPACCAPSRGVGRGAVVARCRPGFLWVPMGSCACVPMDSIGFRWVTIGSYAWVPFIPMDSYGFLWVPVPGFLDSHEFLWVPMPGLLWFLLVPMSSDGLRCPSYGFLCLGSYGFPRLGSL